MSNSGKFAMVAGVVYLLVGLLGFVVTGFGDFASSDGETLIILDVNPLHNIVHILLGVVWLAAASRPAAVKGVNMLFGIVLTVLGVAGFFIQDTGLDVLALNSGDNLIHLATGVLALFFAMSDRQAATTA